MAMYRNPVLFLFLKFKWIGLEELEHVNEWNYMEFIRYGALLRTLNDPEFCRKSSAEF